MLSKMSRDERLQLMRFVCSFAWADLEIREKERSFVKKLMKRLDLDAEERKQVDEWLAVPPEAEDVDPQRIPREHRKIFLETARQLINADGHVDPEERENLALLEMLTR